MIEVKSTYPIKIQLECVTNPSLMDRIRRSGPNFTVHRKITVAWKPITDAVCISNPLVVV